MHTLNANVNAFMQLKCYNNPVFNYWVTKMRCIYRYVKGIICALPVDKLKCFNLRRELNMVDFKYKQAAQSLAYLISLDGGRSNILKLVKLIYLCEREYLNRYDDSMFNDSVVTMKNGLVLSGIYDCIKDRASISPLFSDFINTRNNNDISAKEITTRRDDYTSLSDADIDVINTVWSKFGSMDQWRLADYHHELKEWQNTSSSIPVSYKEILEAIGKPDASMIALDIEEGISITKALNKVSV